MKIKVAVLLVLSLGIMSFTGCKKDDVSNPTDSSIKIWMPNSMQISGFTDRSQFPVKANFEENLGVKIEYIFPTLGQEWQQFNVLLASKALPDIVQFYWSEVSGGPDKAISDNYILGMDEEFLKKNAPDFLKTIKDKKEYERLVKTDSGKFYSFPKLFDFGGEENVGLYTNGYMMRADWLKDLNLTVPETIDEWYNVLKSFKDKKGATTPFSLQIANLKRGFEGAYNISLNYYVDNNQVKYGYYEPAYKDYLTTMRKWYSEGLLDNSFANIDKKMVDSKILNGEAGATFGWLGSGMGVWLNAKKDAKFDLVGVPFPTVAKGIKAEFGIVSLPVSNISSVISATSKKPELAAKVLNYGYSDKGHLFCNFGIEGETYTLENGEPKYTDLVTNNPDKLTMTEVLQSRSGQGVTNSYREDYRYINQYYKIPQQKEAQKIWMKTNMQNHIMPIVYLTEEETSVYTKIMTEVTTYQDEMYLKFIMGDEPISNFDKYIAEMKKMGIERAIEIKNAAYQRYLSR